MICKKAQILHGGAVVKEGVECSVTRQVAIANHLTGVVDALSEALHTSQSAHISKVVCLREG